MTVAKPLHYVDTHSKHFTHEIAITVIEKKISTAFLWLPLNLYMTSQSIKLLWIFNRKCSLVALIFLELCKNTKESDFPVCIQKLEGTLSRFLQKSILAVYSQVFWEILDVADG